MPSAAPAPRPDERPGRTCPVAYRYPPRVFRREPDVAAETLYVVGGLYGNVEALHAVLEMAAAEPGPVTLAFNGDFHWFDADPADFAAIESGTDGHARLRGNVETEVAGEDAGAGCGCAYPADVSDDDVARSNAILERLRETARAFPRERAALGALPMHLLARVGAARVGLVHGDAASLAGWGFSHHALAQPAHRRWIESAFAESGVDLFASSHTCLPAIAAFETAHGPRLVANNGAAGMPNFAGERHGLLTRIGVQRSGREPALAPREIEGVHVELLPIRYAREAWHARFRRTWPEGSPAHASYWKRLDEGPRFHPDEAARQAA